ncbi:hypothetical protein [Scytonema sp. NUACC26]
MTNFATFSLFVLILSLLVFDTHRSPLAQAVPGLSLSALYPSIP